MLPAIITGAAALAGGLLGNRQRSNQAQRDRDWQTGEAGKNRMFQERMRNTSWQAGVEDMKAAGINPALAYSQGGASSPSGGMGGGAMAQQNDIISPAVSSAQHARRLTSELKNMRSQRELMYNQARLAANQTRKEGAQTELIYRNQKNMEIQNQIAALRLPQLQQQAQVYRGRAGGVLEYTNAIRQSLFGGGGLGSVIGGTAGAYVGARVRKPTVINQIRR